MLASNGEASVRGHLADASVRTTLGADRDAQGRWLSTPAEVRQMLALKGGDYGF